MSEHGKKMVAPVLVTVIMVIYYILFFTLLVHLLGRILGIVLGILPAGLACVMIYVCIQRIREIQEGEEDDLSKY